MDRQQTILELGGISSMVENMNQGVILGRSSSEKNGLRMVCNIIELKPYLAFFAPAERLVGWGYRVGYVCQNTHGLI
jgi:hypothetical protein